MDPRNDDIDEPGEPVEVPVNEPVAEPLTSDKTDDDIKAPASEPAPAMPEIVPADQPLQGETTTADFSTVGTGSVFAISCSLLAMLIVLVCVGFFILFRIF